MASLPVEAVFTKGDTKADYKPTLKDPTDDTAIDVSGFTVKLYWKDRRAGTTGTEITAALTDPTNGIVTFGCSTIAAATGTYDCHVELTDGGALVQRMQDFRLVTKGKVEE
jgi:hypothetical protein